MTLRVCILETDNLYPYLATKYKNYENMFRDLFDKQSVSCEITAYNVKNGEYPENDLSFDGYLITGSKSDSFSSELWILEFKKYLLDLYHARKKLIGVCFGHQILALILGGEVSRCQKGWGVGMHSYNITDRYSWMQPSLGNYLNLLVSHQDQVNSLPKNATCIASSEFCSNAAYVISNQVLCFQGHPEFTGDFSKDLLNLRKESLPENIYQEGIHSLSLPHDGVIVAQWMMNFLKS